MKAESKAQQIWQLTKKKTASLSNAIKQDPKQGLQWWLKTHKQEDEFSAVIAELNSRAPKGDFDLATVIELLSPFILKEYVQGILDWISAAQQKMEQLHNYVQENEKVDQKMLKAVIKELDFILKEQEFFNQLDIQPVQEAIKAMFNELNQRLKETIENQNKLAELEQQQKQLEIEQQIAKQAAEENAKLDLEKRKALAIAKKMEQEKLAKIALKEAKQVEIQRMEKLQEFQARQAEEKRMAELQGSYASMQLDVVDTDNLISTIQKRDLTPQQVAELKHAIDKS